VKIIACDIGKQNDYSVVASLRGSGDSPRKYAVVSLDRWRHEKYQVTIAKLLQMARRHPDAAVAIDGGGVGRPVVDLVRDGLPRRKVYSVVSTGGRNVNAGQEPGDVCVPKRDLIETVRVLLQNRRLIFSPELPLLRELQTEFRQFEEKRTEKLNVTYEGAGAHDDMVSAVAIGCWVGENQPRPLTDERIQNCVLNVGPGEPESGQRRTRMQELAAEFPHLFGD
jgi:hypothetical protein